MKLKTLLKTVRKAYEEDNLLELHPDGDGLAKFILDELSETYDEDATSLEQYREALRVMTAARDDLQRIIDALEKHT